MPRPSLVTVAVVLCVAMLGVVAVAATQSALDKRKAPARAQTQQRQQPVVRTITPDARDLKPAERLKREGAGNDGVPAAVPGTAPAPGPAPVKPAPKPEPTFGVVQVKSGRTVALHSKPGGSVVDSVGATTEFGSPSTLAVAERRGRWLGVTSTDLPNGKIAWVERSRVNLSSHSTHVSIRIDLSRRQLVLRDGRKVVRRLSVGIGRPGSTTPTGRYAITDKLPGSRYSSSVYGCCILALSGHQTNTPAGWRGGDRLAIHGTSNPASIGVPSSAGCLHADERSLQLMMRRVPLGTPVFIRS